MKVGTVALIGRPNTGKSTLVNNLVGQKVTITSPKPQTTQFPIYAVYEDSSTPLRAGRGQIIFVDTPGIFAKTKNLRDKSVNLEAENILKEKINLILYIIDHTRERGLEENRVLGIIRKVPIPKILVINKIDIEKPSYIEQYKFLEDEFDKIHHVSALKGKHLEPLIADIFSFLPEGEKIVERENLPLPTLNIDSKLYIEELIREKAFLRLRREVPYKIQVIADKITEKEGGLLYVKARIICPAHYKSMIIGQGGSKIKEIGSMARKELEIAGRRKVYIDLVVEALD